jgi:hypothetical protein
MHHKVVCLSCPSIQTSETLIRVSMHHKVLYVCHAHPSKSPKTLIQVSMHHKASFVCLSCPSIPKAYDLTYGLNKLLYSTSHLFPWDTKCPSTIIESIEKNHRRTMYVSWKQKLLKVRLKDLLVLRLWKRNETKHLTL